ncbi:6-hydroxymethylpterin diphosphokinase MptE-like protein [Lysobacter sp. A286]
MSRFSLLHDRHRGERCVLIANGPSLNRMDLSFLRRQTVIGMNKIFLGFRKFDFYPQYYVAVNRKVLEQSANIIKTLNCVKFISDRADGIIPESGLSYRINTTRAPNRFCHDIAKGVHEGWTVTYAALQVAHYMGFREVVLIGMDHRFEYAGAPNQTQTLNGPDPNHFSPDYFGHGQSWDNPDLAHSEESYRIARCEYERSGRRIIDATLDGACDIFEKADYTALGL